MTDREMLELAAKAASVPTETYNGVIHYIREWVTPAGKVLRSTDYWNPLTDDGDALRLAVKLKLCVDTDCGGFPYAWKGDAEWIEDNTEQDPYAATRRAITRAAAELGKMKGEK